MHRVFRWSIDPRSKMSVILYIGSCSLFIWYIKQLHRYKHHSLKVKSIHESLVVRFSFDKTRSCEPFVNVDFSCADNLEAVIGGDVRQLSFNTMLKWRKIETLEISRWEIEQGIQKIWPGWEGKKTRKKWMMGWCYFNLVLPWLRYEFV